MLSRSRLRTWLLVPCCLFLAGCVTKSESGAEVTVHYEWWLPLGMLVAGVLAIPIGLAVRKNSTRLGWGLIIAGPIAALGFAPSFLFERVFIHDRGFEVHSGI